MSEHMPAPSDLTEALAAIRRAMATNVRDWGADRMDAFLWGVLVGWDCDELHDHIADFCDGSAMTEVAGMHGWDADQVARVRRFRAAIERVSYAAASHTPEAAR